MFLKSFILIWIIHKESFIALAIYYPTIILPKKTQVISSVANYNNSIVGPGQRLLIPQPIPNITAPITSFLSIV